MSDAADFVPIDAEARAAAVRVLDRPLLVEAGAGTGKTRLLVDRIVHAVECSDLDMARVVAISFTEKAAAELRLRVRRGLEERLVAADLAAGGRERIGQALGVMDRATLSTIHAFAAAILREQPVQARIDPRFRTLDELESARFFREFWERWVAFELEREPAAAGLRAALLAGVRLEPDLHELGRDLELQRDVAHQIWIPRAVPDLELRLRALRDDMLACVHHAEANCNDATDAGLRRLRALGRTLAMLEDLDPSSWPGVFLGPLSMATAAGRKEAWRPGEAARSKARRRELATRLESVRREISDDLLHGMLGWLERFRMDFAREKRRRGVLDFQDLLIEARALVRDDPAVRRDLASRFDMLCVDEFQDTDPLQAELVLFLAETGGPAADWRQVRVGPRLFLVGDPRQSIYRFRRADLDVYDECVRIVLDSGGQRLTVQQNFRSRPALLQWTNGVFERLFAPVSGGVPGPRHVSLEPVYPPGTEPAVWVLRPPAEPGPPPGDGWRREEAAALVSWLRHALDTGFPVRTEKAPRPMRPGDVALLFARTSGIEHYEDALRRAGLPFRQEGGRLFFRRQEVRDLLQALAAVDDPHDELAIVGALRSPLFGATDEELWLHRAARPGFSYLEPAAGSPLAARLALLAALHAERQAAGIAGTIAALLDRTEARAVLAARPQGSQALANVEMLQRLAREFEASRPAGLREFVHSLRDVDEEAPRVAEWTPQDEDAERVRLLTVHVAKGLEFPCVVLANLAAGANRRPGAVLVDRIAGQVEARLNLSDVGVSLATAGHTALATLERQREDAEERRLLYVAATRARDYLVVPCYRGQTAPQGLLRALSEVPAAMGEGGEFGALPAPVRGVDAAPGAAWCVVVGRTDRPRAQSPLRPPPASDVASLWRRRVEHPLRHAERLRRGGAGTPVAVPPLGLEPGTGAAGAAWPRLRALLAHGLQSLPVDRGGAELDSALLALAALHGSSDLVPELRLGLLSWRQSALGERAARSRRARYGVRITTASGGTWIETWLDCILEEGDGVALVELEPGAPAVRDEGGLVPEESLLWKALAVAAAGEDVRGAGSFFLSSGDYVPVADFAAKLERFWRQVEAR